MQPQFLKVPLSEKEKVQLQRNQAALQRQKSIYAQIGNRYLSLIDPSRP